MKCKHLWASCLILLTTLWASAQQTTLLDMPSNYQRVADSATLQGVHTLHLLSADRTHSRILPYCPVELTQMTPRIDTVPTQLYFLHNNVIRVTPGFKIIIKIPFLKTMFTGPKTITTQLEYETLEGHYLDQQKKPIEATRLEPVFIPHN